MNDYNELIERLTVSAGDQECLYSDAKEAIVVLLCAYKSVAKQLHDAEDVLKQNILNEFWRIGVIDGQPGWIQHYCHERKEVVKDPLTLDGELHCTILPAVEAIKAERDSLQSRVAEAEDTNKALRVRLGSELERANELVADLQAECSELRGMAGAEREACAKVCEEQERGSGDAMTFYTAAGQCAAAIRNRKDTTA